MAIVYRYALLLTAFMVTACAATENASSTSTTATNPLDAEVTNATQFKAKYRPLFYLGCGAASCYVTKFGPVYNQMPRDAEFLPRNDRLNVRSRIITGLNEVDDLIRKGCDDGTRDATTECQLASLGPEATAKYFRDYFGN